MIIHYDIKISSFNRCKNSKLEITLFRLKTLSVFILMIGYEVDRWYVLLKLFKQFKSDYVQQMEGVVFGNIFYSRDSYYYYLT